MKKLKIKMNSKHFRKLCIEGRKHNPTYRLGFVMLNNYKHVKTCYYTNEVGNDEVLTYITPADYAYQYNIKTKYKDYSIICHHRFSLSDDTKIIHEIHFCTSVDNVRLKHFISQGTFKKLMTVGIKPLSENEIDELIIEQKRKIKEEEIQRKLQKIEKDFEYESSKWYININ